MHKVSNPYREKHRPNKWWIRWIISGRRHTKCFNSLQEAKSYRQRKYIELNMDVYGAQDLPYEYAKTEYLKRYDLEGLASESKKISERMFKQFENVHSVQYVSQIHQKAVDDFIEAQQKRVKSAYSVNKYISRFKAFINYLKECNYHHGRLKIKNVKTVEPIKTALTDEQIIALIKACPDYDWQIRIVFSLCTGLRAGDVDRLPKGCIDEKRAMLSYIARKTGKGSNCTPLPTALIPALKRLDNGGYNTLFNPVNCRKTFEAIRSKAGLSCTRQDFRVTFSTLIQTFDNSDVARKLLQHYSVKTTKTHYSDNDLIMRIKIEKFNPLIKKWLK
jgi:integrase